MIRVEKITINEFRGIRSLTLEPKGQNFAACGPNGTGKSGIVDAIEFALTGNVSRLSGRGTGDLSVKQHGPHVDFRDKPEASSVTLEVSIPSLKGKKATVHRTVKNATTPTITPAEPDVIAALEDIRLHPEFVLSRRELIRYVIAEPGDRAKEVQALLRLEEVEKLRQVLQKIANACAKEVGPLERAERDAAKHLTDALGIAQLGKAELLAAVNAQRQILALPSLVDLTPATVLSDGVVTATGAGAPQTVPKVQATADLGTLQSALDVLKGQAAQDRCKKAAAAAGELDGDPASANGVKREALLKSALELYDEEHCPVCDTPFTPEAFVPHLKEKLVQLDEIAAKRAALEKQLSPILDAIHAAGSALATVIGYGPLLKPSVDLKALADFKQVLLGRYGQLQKVLPLADTEAVLNVAHEVPDLNQPLTAVENALALIPEPSKQDAARTYLVVAQTRMEQLREARQSLAGAKARAEQAALVFKVFADTTTKALEHIYNEVQGAFATYYAEINKDDESTFSAKLIPSLGKLGFNVDFYGKGLFPPGAYHSEGHQDGMGLCLYLALMNHLLGSKFTISVLDDVLMSVDRAHRREVCALLKKQFPDTQFILTTHDDVWLRHMRSEGIIKGKNFVHFKTWSVELGPTQWSDATVWDEIDGHLTKNDVSMASAVLRRYLEYFAGEASQRLRGKVEYRGDAQFMLGDLLPGATTALGDALKKARVAASSWGQTESVTSISARETAFTEAKAKANVDQWQVNTAVHYNPWADLTKEDFVPVVAAYRAFTESFFCPSCEEMFRISPERGPKDSLQCGCAALNLNAKPGAAKDVVTA